MLDHWSADPGAFPESVREAYIDQFRDPERRRAICEQYRAAGTIDVQHDNSDAGVRKIPSPLLALWSKDGPVDSWYEPLEVWREWADDVRGRSLDGGHFLPEENPDAVLAALQDFLAGV